MTIHRDRIIAERQDDGGFLVMFPEGTVLWFRTKHAVLVNVRSFARNVLKARNVEAHVAEIEWRNLESQRTPA